MRFFAEFKENDLEVKITGQDAIHIKKVLRKKTDDVITITNSQGFDFICKITEITDACICLAPIEKLKNSTEPDIKVTLFQGLPKSGKMELIIQKCVELGIYEIVPVVTRYSVVKPKRKFDDKLLRYQKISESAAKQCGRGIIPQIRNVMNLDEAVDFASHLDMSIAAYEREDRVKIKDVIKDKEFRSVGLFVGPEGGFSDEEVWAFVSADITPISLGRRILRTETAGFTGLTILFNEMGEF